MLLADYSWYVVMTDARSEQVAARAIRDRGYQSLFLHTTDWQGHGPEMSRLIKRPWLPRYIFAGLGPEHFVSGVPVLGKVAKARGVAAVVRSPGGEPFPVPLRAMELLTERAELPSGLVWTRKTAHHFAGRPGYAVRLSNKSPYQGFLAAIVNSDLRGQIIVELEIFGRKVPTHIGLEDVEQLFDQSGNPIDKCELAPEP